MIRTARARRLAAFFGAVALVLSATARGAPSVDCGPPPDGAICANGPWFDFATMNVRLVHGVACDSSMAELISRRLIAGMEGA